MGVKSMWRANASMLALLILVNLAMSMAGETIWIIVGVAMLLLSMYLNYRQGSMTGHGACGIRNTVEDARKAGEAVYAQLDRDYLSQVWSVNTGVRGLLASALIPYAAGCVYIALSLLNVLDPQGVPMVVVRIVAWILSLPYWPVIMHWHEDFVTLTPAIVAVLMISPFVLPACTFLGYLRGPKLWARTEQAMKEGRRRAKAKARVGKKLVPRQQKPEI